MKARILLSFFSALIIPNLTWTQNVRIRTSDGADLRDIRNYTVTANALLFYASTGDGRRMVR
ncbi:hypothetical protein [Runella sp.]|uniref:hypothetical protein n=1 Tax=Runella sp. TaxID=1960881 RepID=UPI00301AB387